MLSGRFLSTILIATMSLPCVAMSHNRRGPTSPKPPKRATKSAKRVSGQRSIDDSRATEIQGALIRSGYMSGEGSGHWDSQTEAAMQKYQSDNGWQTKLMPDSRAIIKLGLGPKQDAPQGGSGVASTSSGAAFGSSEGITSVSAFASQR